MSKSLTIKEFAAEIGVCEKLAYGMARCEVFQKHRISHDIGIKPGRKKRTWRIDLERYYDARDKGLI